MNRNQKAIITVTGTLAAASASAIVVAPATVQNPTRQIYVVSVYGNVFTPAAQAVTIQDSSGVVPLLRFPNSSAGEKRWQAVVGSPGIALPVTRGITIQTTGAGVELDYAIEYYIEQTVAQS